MKNSLEVIPLAWVLRVKELQEPRDQTRINILARNLFQHQGSLKSGLPTIQLTPSLLPVTTRYHLWAGYVFYRDTHGSALSNAVQEAQDACALCRSAA